MIKNFFGIEIKPFMELKDDGQTMELCKVLLQEVFEALGIVNREIITDAIFNALTHAKNQKDWERQVFQWITPLVKNDIRKQYWDERAVKIISWFLPFLNSPVFEFGCDDGVVGKTISSNGYSVIIADVFRHANVGSIGLPFYLFKEGTELPLKAGSFKSVTLSSVLHHCNNPSDTVREAKRVLDDDGLLLVSESVFGLAPHDLRGATGRLHIEQFSELSPEQQLEVNVFFEIIYHRILNFSEREEDMIHIPYNYLPAKLWPRWFEEQGLQIINWWPVGISHKIGPLCHAVYILKKS